MPVHGLVRDEAGRPCYAMRFLRGATLTDAIRRFHEGSGLFTEGPRGLEFRGLLQRFVAVCQAVAYAHSRGVIHRDIKPHNVMLGDYGETLVVDWGLAKSVGLAPSGGRESPETGETTLRPTLVAGGSETQMGSALGTPAYMSPEQATGRWDTVGPASDIYSLGATLYHLLTGRAPFSGGDVHAIRDRVIAGEFPSPRQVNAAVPAALAAVCGKALARKPENRFATARELAADVEHWLADEPLSAYREPLLARTRRWLRRHRTLTTGVAAALMAAVLKLSAGLVLVEVQKRETRHQAAIAEGERQNAQAQEAIAKAQRLRTRQALDDMLSEESLDWLKTQKELLPQQKQFLERALRYYQEFAQEQANDEAGRALLASARFRVGRDFQILGRLPEAEGPYRAAVADYQKLAADFPTESRYRQDMATTRNSLGLLLDDLGKRPEAEAVYRAALEVQQQLASDFPTVPGYRHDLALTRANLGNVLLHLGKRSEAEAEYRAALEVQQRLAADFPAVALYAVDLGRSYYNFGWLVRDGGQPAAALDWYAKAIATLGPLVQAEPRLVTARQVLRNSHWGRAAVLAQLRRYAEAAAAVEALTAGRADGDTLYNAACVFALTSTAGPPDPKRKEGYAARAVALLRRARAAGLFHDPAIIDHLKKDTDLDGLRGRADFQAFVRELEAAKK